MRCNLLLVNGIKKLSLFQIFAFGGSKVKRMHNVNYLCNYVHKL